MDSYSELKEDFLKNVFSTIENYKTAREKYKIKIANSLSEDPEF